MGSTSFTDKSFMKADKQSINETSFPYFALSLISLFLILLGTHSQGPGANKQCEARKFPSKRTDASYAPDAGSQPWRGQQGPLRSPRPRAASAPPVPPHTASTSSENKEALRDQMRWYMIQFQLELILQNEMTSLFLIIKAICVYHRKKYNNV